MARMLTPHGLLRVCAMSDQQHKRQRRSKERRTVREGGKWKRSCALNQGTQKKPSAADVSEKEYENTDE